MTASPGPPPPSADHACRRHCDHRGRCRRDYHLGGRGGWHRYNGQPGQHATTSRSPDDGYPLEWLR
jgi:hypothetical protein